MNALADVALFQVDIDKCARFATNADEAGFVRLELFEQGRGAERRTVGSPEPEPVIDRPIGAHLVGPVTGVLIGDTRRRLLCVHIGQAGRTRKRQALEHGDVLQDRYLNFAKQLLRRRVTLGNARSRVAPCIAVGRLARVGDVGT